MPCGCTSRPFYQRLNQRLERRSDTRSRKKRRTSTPAGVCQEKTKRRLTWDWLLNETHDLTGWTFSAAAHWPYPKRGLRSISRSSQAGQRTVVAWFVREIVGVPDGI